MAVRPKNLFDPSRVEQSAEELSRYFAEGGQISALIPLSSETLSSLYRLGYQRFQRKEYSEARKTFALLTFVAPQMEDYWLALAASLDLEGKTSLAIDTYELLLQFSADADCKQSLAACYEKMGDYQKAAIVRRSR